MAKESRTPIMDALVQELKRRFWAYTGPDAFDNPDQPGEKTTFALREAEGSILDDLLKNSISRAVCLGAFFELAPGWLVLKNLFKEFSPPAEVNMGLFLGRSVKWELDYETRTEILTRLFNPSGYFLEELGEELSNIADQDPKLTAEDIRRCEAAGFER